MIFLVSPEGWLNLNSIAVAHDQTEDSRAATAVDARPDLFGVGKHSELGAYAVQGFFKGHKAPSAWRQESSFLFLKEACELLITCVPEIKAEVWQLI